MRTVICIVLIITVWSCKPSPDYDPFNQQYDVSVGDLVKDGCVTISAGCGYFNLQAKEGRLRPYYQLFVEDADEVLAKGFTYYEDTLIIEGLKTQFGDNLMQTLLSKPIDSLRLNSELARFNYQYIGRSGEQIKIGSIDGGSVLNLELIIDILKEDSAFIRQIHYWKSKR